MSCQVDDFDLTKFFILRLIQIWECALNWLILEPIYECLVDICDLRSQRAVYPKQIYLLIPMCK